jgi:hypothetical protein
VIPPARIFNPTTAQADWVVKTPKILKITATMRGYRGGCWAVGAGGTPAYGDENPKPEANAAAI